METSLLATQFLPRIGVLRTRAHANIAPLTKQYTLTAELTARIRPYALLPRPGTGLIDATSYDG